MRFATRLKLPAMLQRNSFGHLSSQSTRSRILSAKERACVWWMQQWVTPHRHPDPSAQRRHRTRSSSDDDQVTLGRGTFKTKLCKYTSHGVLTRNRINRLYMGKATKQTRRFGSHLVSSPSFGHGKSLPLLRNPPHLMRSYSIHRSRVTSKGGFQMS
jgi:hypothetical protein